MVGGSAVVDTAEVPSRSERRDQRSTGTAERIDDDRMSRVGRVQSDEEVGQRDRKGASLEAVTFVALFKCNTFDG